MTLSDEVRKYLFYCQYQKQLDQKTIEAYRIDLDQFIEFIAQYNNEITKENFNSFLVYLHGKYKQKSVKRKIASIKAYFNYMESEEILVPNPIHSVKMKFKEDRLLPKAIPKDKIEILLKYLYKMNSNCNRTSKYAELILRDIAMIELLFATGIRISELCNLKVKECDLEQGVLCILGKGSKERYIQIGNTDVIEILNKYKLVFINDIMKQSYFFLNRYGERLSEQSARRIIHKHGKAAMIDMNITPHMFRHAFATLLLEEDVDIRYIQKMLGHSSIVTTQIYTFVTSKKQQEILKAKHPRNKMLLKRISDYKMENS